VYLGTARVPIDGLAISNFIRSKNSLVERVEERGGERGEHVRECRKVEAEKCMNESASINTHRDRDRETRRQRGTGTETQRHKYRQRQRDRDKYTDIETQTIHKHTVSARRGFQGEKEKKAEGRSFAWKAFLGRKRKK
jgi:hypothetical protein